MGMTENETHVGILSISVNKSTPNSYIVIRIRCFFVFMEYNDVREENLQVNLYKKVCREMENKNFNKYLKNIQKEPFFIRMAQICLRQIKNFLDKTPSFKI